MNHTDNRDEQEDRALFICVCIEAPNKRTLQELENERTHLCFEKGVHLQTPVSLPCRLHVIFSINPPRCHISVSFPARTVGNILGKAGL